MFKPYKSDWSDAHGYPPRDSDAFFYMGGYYRFGRPVLCVTTDKWFLLWEPMTRADAIQYQHDYFPRIHTFGDGSSYYVYNAKGGFFADDEYGFIHSPNKNTVKTEGRRQRPRLPQIYVNWHEEDTGFQIMLDKIMEGPKLYEGPTGAGFGNRKLKKIAGSTCGMFSATEIDFMRKWVDYVTGDCLLNDVHIGRHKIQNRSAFDNSMGKTQTNFVLGAYASILEHELTERIRSGEYSGVHSPWPAFKFDRPTLPINREPAMVGGGPLGYARLIYQAMGNDRGSTILFPRKSIIRED